MRHLVLEHLVQRAPSRLENRAIETGFRLDVGAGRLHRSFRRGRHALCLSPLQDNGARSAGQVPAHMMPPVLANMGLCAAHFGDPLDRFSPPNAVSCLSGGTALQPLDLPLQLGICRHCVNDPIAVGHLTNMAVQPDDMTIVDRGENLHLIADDGHPAPPDARQRG